ncbi:MAG: lipoprotein [Pseudomonadota bacterium]
MHHRILGLLCLLALSGCGQYGPLRLPEPNNANNQGQTFDVSK